MREYPLRDVRQARLAVDALLEQVRPGLEAGKRYVVTVKEDTRSAAQNRLLHSRINDVARHVEWAGARRHPEAWKRLLTAAWLRAVGEQVELLPALDGHGVDVVFRRTSELTRSECAELSEFVMAWGDDKSVPWSRASLGPDWAGMEGENVQKV